MSVVLTGKVEQTVRAWGRKQGLKSPAEAAEKLVATAISRKAALAKYAAKQALKVRRIRSVKKAKKVQPKKGGKKLAA
jgi:hypothetical protein